MEKVKIFSTAYIDKLEKSINEFIKDVDVVDIQFIMAPPTAINSYTKYAAMVMYEVKE